MAEFDWLDFETGPGGYGWGDVGADYSSGYDAPIGPGLGWDAGGYPTGGYNEPIGPGLGWDAGGYPTGGASGGNWLQSILGGLSGAGKFLGQNAGTLGPLLSGLGSLGGGAIGSNAANDAARLQSAALNRGIDLSTSQWLNQLERSQPWVQAGQQALGTLQGLAGREAPQFQDPAAAISGANYAMPGTTPGWNPQMYQGPQGPNAGDYRWNPQAGPQAAGFRYSPGAVPTLSGQELLANDPGVAFRLAEGRKALEGSAAARGGLLSGPTLAALQRSGQELSSQEYSNAWNRASQQAQLREQWNQTASQLGWNQAQAEAAFREQQAQLASQQGWNQALQGQQNQFTQGLDTSKWNTLQQQQWAQEQYKNMLEQSKLRYGMDVSQNTTDYDRAQQLYRQRLGQHLLPWEQNSTLAQLGAQVTGQLGNQGVASSSGISNLLAQLGTAQGTGAAGQGLAWTRALGGAANQLPSLLAGLNA